MSKMRILLTGADSLTGSHILDLLLSENDVFVRAIVGSREQAFVIREQYRHRSTSYDVVVVLEDDVTRLGAYDNALCDEAGAFHAVFHIFTASPISEADCLARYIRLESDLLINFLQSVQHLAKQVRRVVLVTSLTPFARWLADDAQAERGRGAASSIDSEYILAASQAGDNIVHDAMSKWFKSACPSFDVVYITTPSCYGPTIRPLETSSDVLEANRRIWNICSNERRRSIETIPYGIAPFSDVRDLSVACVRAMYTPRAGNKRLIVSAGVMPSNSRIAECLGAQFQDLSSRLMYGKSPLHGSEPDDSPSWATLDALDTSATVAILGLSTYRPIEQTLTDTARQILDLQRRKTWRRIIQS